MADSRYNDKMLNYSNMFLIIRRFWYLGLIIIVLLGIVFYSRFKSSDISSFNSYEIKKQTLHKSLSLTGEIMANERSILHFQTGGRLNWLGVKEGDMVKKYDGIASLDTRQLQKTLEKYLNIYSKQRQNFEQTNDDNDTLVIALSKDLRDRAERTLKNAQFDLENSVLDVELQAIAKEFSLLYTPIPGIVTRMSVTTPGTNISVSDTFEIVNPESLYFSVLADQTDVINITKGQKGKIVFDSFPDQEIDATVDSISFAPVQGESGTVYEVKLTFDKSSNPYLLGMTGDVEFVLSEIENVLAVPYEFVEDINDKTFVYVQKNNKSIKTEIVLGEEYQGLYQVLDGVKIGEIINEIKN